MTLRPMAIGVLSMAAALVGAAAQQPPAFRFVHLGGARAATVTPPPAFAVATGALTGPPGPADPAGAAAALRSLGFPLHIAAASRDVLASATGKEGLRKEFGALHKSFDHGGCHFVVLDSTLELQHYGHLDGAQLQWLDKDLKRLRKGTPVFLFLHHPLGREGSVLDNEDRLLRTVGPHNIVAAFTSAGEPSGPGHANGIPLFAAPASGAAGHLVEVSGQDARVFRLPSDGGPPERLATLAVEPRPQRRVAFGWDDAMLPLLARRQFLAELWAERRTIKAREVAAEYCIDGGPWRAMERDTRVHPASREISEGRFMARFETKGLRSGWHALRIRMTAPDGEVFTRQESFVFEQLDQGPRERWSAEFGEGIQASPMADGGVVFVASLDGRAYAFEAAGGKRRWVRATKGALVAAPLIWGDTLYAGSADHLLYALDRGNGRVRWTFDTGAPVLSTPAVAGGVAAAAAAGRVHGLDAATGRPKWSAELPVLPRSAIAADEGAFYVGGADNSLHAVEAEGGRQLWSARLEGGSLAGADMSAPAAGGTHAYVVSRGGVLHALEKRTGRVAWTAAAPRDGGRFSTAAPRILGSRVIVAGLGSDGDVYALEAASGSLAWRTRTGFAGNGAPPGVANGRVVVASVQGVVSWIDPATGRLEHQYGLPPGHCLSSPAGEGALTFAASLSGRLLALAAP